MMKTVSRICAFAMALTYAIAIVPSPVIFMVIFSKNRPLQLAGCLQSIREHVSGLNRINVLYAADPEYQAAYLQVQREHPGILYLAEHDFSGSFKQALQSLTRDQPDYIIFGVDDNIVMRPIDLMQQAALLEQHKAYGYYNRLGSNITYSYAIDRASIPPQLTPVNKSSYLFRTYRAAGDWGYPNTVDMTLYRWSDVKDMVTKVNYTNPNTFEGSWSSHMTLPARYDHRALCPLVSTITNLPMNRVQKVWSNRHENSFDTLDLLHMYENGFRLDLQELYSHTFNSPHSAYTPQFVKIF